MALGLHGPNETLIGTPGSRHALGTPALVLDLDAMEANIVSMAQNARLHGYDVRPVAKIHKSVEIARRQMAAGASVHAVRPLLNRRRWLMVPSQA